MAIKRPVVLREDRRICPGKPGDALSVHWSGDKPSPGAGIKAADLCLMARKMLAALGFRRAELSVVFLSGPAMRRLNRKALGHDHVTDVLTFDLTGAGCSSSVKMLEAEIYICPDEARRNARAYGEPFSAEIIRYVAHGLLHLCGFRDRSPSQQARMRRHEEALISAVDLPSFLSRMKSKKVLL